MRRLSATDGVLGRTLRWILFDAREGFSLDYFLRVANALEAGGTLTLLLDSQQFSPDWVDPSMKRVVGEPAPAPNFYRYLKTKLGEVEEGNPSNRKGGEALSSLSEAQWGIYTQFNAERGGIFTLFSPRGVGKSRLGAALYNANRETVLLTAPNQAAVEQYGVIERGSFRAVDDLILNYTREELLGYTLLVEEAAAIPLKHLITLSRLFEKILLISSIDNYEGSKQGLIYKLDQLLPISAHYKLSENFRFNSKDPLADFCRSLAFEEEPLLPISSQESGVKIEFVAEERLADLQRSPAKIAALYRLLKKTHYQTNIQDIRRLFDQKKQCFLLAWRGKDLIGMVWGLREGELSRSLADAVFRGLRRPRGNLVPQLLSAQSYYPEAMEMRSLRISRISVLEPFRFQGVAKKMLEKLTLELGKSFDFLSVSFGLTDSLLTFWRKMGYEWIHIGSHRDRVTALHAAVMIKLLSSAGIEWFKEVERKWRGDLYYLREAPHFSKDAQRILQKEDFSHSSFDERDRLALEAHRVDKKSYHSVYCALKREESCKN